MISRRKTGTLRWLCVLLLFLPQERASVATFAQAPADTLSGSPLKDEDEWSRLRSIPRDAELTVSDNNGGLVMGRFRAVSSEGITLRTRAGTVVIPRYSVTRIGRIHSTGRVRAAKTGFLIGAALGGFVGATTVESNKGPWVIMLSAGWGGVGAFIGATGSEGQRRLVIAYESP